MRIPLMMMPARQPDDCTRRLIGLTATSMPKKAYPAVARINNQGKQFKLKRGGEKRRQSLQFLQDNPPFLTATTPTPRRRSQTPMPADAWFSGSATPTATATPCKGTARQTAPHAAVP